jgi:hypothetical protein
MRGGTTLKGRSIVTMALVLVTMLAVAGFAGGG